MQALAKGANVDSIVGAKDWEQTIRCRHVFHGDVILSGWIAPDGSANENLL
jgi:hypothetical protein